MSRLELTKAPAEQPPPQQTLCRNCYCSFTSSAKWWFGRWIYGNTCRTCVIEMEEKTKRFVRADGKEVRKWVD